MQNYNLNGYALYNNPNLPYQGTAYVFGVFKTMELIWLRSNLKMKPLFAGSLSLIFMEYETEKNMTNDHNLFNRATIFK